jgi:hypothetical protein
MYNPRILGTYPCDSVNLVHFNLESFFARPDRSKLSVQGTHLQNMDCWKLEFTRRDGMICRAWFDPNQGYSPVRLETEFSTPGGPALNVLECVVSRIPETRVWFPTSCHYQHRRNGELLREEVLKVKVLSLNSGIPDKVFSPQGMDIPAGTHVQVDPRDPRGDLIWDGRDFVPKKAMVPPKQAGFETGSWLLAASLGLAGAAQPVGGEKGHEPAKTVQPMLRTIP